MKKLLTSILLALLICSASASSVDINEHRRTPAIATVSSSGTVALGARSVTFIFSSDFAGTVLGATFAGTTDSSITFVAPLGDSLAAIAYTRSAGSIRIVTIR